MKQKLDEIDIMWFFWLYAVLILIVMYFLFNAFNYLVGAGFIMILWFIIRYGVDINELKKQKELI